MTRAAWFLAGFAAAGALFWAIGFAGRSAAMLSSADLVSALATAAYLLTVQAVTNGIVYAAVTSIGSRRADRPRKRIMAIDAIGGALASIMIWVGLPTLMLAPFRSLLGAASMAWLGLVLPGIVTGVLGAAVTWRVRPRSTLPSPPGSSASSDTPASALH